MAASQTHVRMAVLEARMSGLSPDVLAIVAFGRDSSSVSDMRSQGSMDVYLMQANLDLMIPQLENGKRSRTAFTLAPEPDLTVLRTADGKLRVRVDGGWRRTTRIRVRRSRRTPAARTSRKAAPR